MFFIELIHNTALLVALTTIYQVTSSRSKKNPLTQTLFFGFLFGIAGVIGMMTPVQYGNGVIFDGRSIILFVAGMFGGPFVAALCASIIGAYRIWLGGVGVYIGVIVTAMAALFGVAFYYYRKSVGGSLNALQLLGAGLLVHLVMLLLFLYLPGGIGIWIDKQLGPTIILFYPVATMLICLLFQDYEEKEHGRVELHRLAYYDSLTGLPNRSLQIDRLNHALLECKNTGAKGALILLNLDRFKTLNEARGHAVGDLLLCFIADRLKLLVEADGMLARMSADEFAVLVQRNAGSTTDIDSVVNHLLDKIRVQLKLPIQLGDDEVIASGSIGIATFPVNIEDDAGDVFRRADTAMHRAKQNGGNQSILFEQSMASVAEQRFKIERELRLAIPAGELMLYLQTQVNAAGVMVGAESLVRWQHPERGLVPPSLFIPVAEETDLIVDVDVWVLTETCRILARQDVYSLPIRVSVNISPRHFRQRSFVSSIKTILADTGADPTHLTLEVTEGLVIDNISEVIAKMTELTLLGIHFSLDDFGTGYSSLSHLKRLPIHELKIDKTFVQDAPHDPDDAALVESVLAIAKHMQLNVVAEGVETQEQADFLNARAEVIHQGYLYSKPVPAISWVQNLA
ncbi:EAL domain-containing protein [Methylotenera sp.]|uniref:EAL domain-containing protein n=1 Tax=Methylotenera sp. TaxID=2051956 RepID=UPI002EDA9DD6